LKSFLFRKGHYLIDLRLKFIEVSQQLKALFCDADVGSSLVIWANLFRDKVFANEPIKQSGDIGIFIEHARLDFSARNAFWMLTFEDAQDIELLRRNFKRLKKILLPTLKPAGSIEQIDQRLLMPTLELRLLYFFFDLHL
jgi:hypothetical protein